MLTEQQKQDAMYFDPFDGDYGGDGASDRVLSDKIVKARVGGTCHLCGQECKPETNVRSRTEVYDGQMMSFRWCEKCCSAMAKYANGNEAPIDKRYALRDKLAA